MNKSSQAYECGTSWCCIDVSGSVLEFEPLDFRCGLLHEVVPVPNPSTRPWNRFVHFRSEQEGPGPRLYTKITGQNLPITRIDAWPLWGKAWAGACYGLLAWAGACYGLLAWAGCLQQPLTYSITNCMVHTHTLVGVTLFAGLIIIDIVVLRILVVHTVC